MYEIGCVSNILQMLKLPDGTVKVLVEGGQRARITEVRDERDALRLRSRRRSRATATSSPEVEALRRAILAQFDQYVKLNKKIPPEILTSLNGIDDAGRLADTIAAHLPIKIEQKQAMLETTVAGRAAREAAHADRDRTRHPAGREAHPRPRQAADGEEPARVLPERAGQGDPEGTRRGRGRRRPRGAREDGSRPRTCPRRRARRPRASSRSSS